METQDIENMTRADFLAELRTMFETTASDDVLIDVALSRAVERFRELKEVAQDELCACGNEITDKEDKFCEECK